MPLSTTAHDSELQAQTDDHTSLFVIMMSAIKPHVSITLQHAAEGGQTLSKAKLELR